MLPGFTSTCLAVVSSSALPSVIYTYSGSNAIKFSNVCCFTAHLEWVCPVVHLSAKGDNGWGEGMDGILEAELTTGESHLLSEIIQQRVITFTKEHTPCCQNPWHVCSYHAFYQRDYLSEK